MQKNLFRFSYALYILHLYKRKILIVRKNWQILNCILPTPSQLPKALKRLIHPVRNGSVRHTVFLKSWINMNPCNAGLCSVRFKLREHSAEEQYLFLHSPSGIIAAYFVIHILFLFFDFPNTLLLCFSSIRSMKYMIHRLYKIGFIKFCILSFKSPL